MLLLHNSDGSEDTIHGTDPDWKWAYGPIQASELYDGEHYDASHQLSDFTNWHDVVTRPVSDHLTAPHGPPVRRTQQLPAKELLRSPSGKAIIDFGQNFVGWVRVTVQGAPGVKIKLRYAEVLENAEIVTRTLRNAKATDTLVLSDTSLTWEPKFTFHGFRYVEIEGWPGELKLSDIIGVVVHTDMQRTGYFSCSNKLLNQLHNNIVWSMRGNFISIPTDCPQRDERLGWTGDMNVFASTANFLFDTAGILTSWLEDLALEQSDAGGIVPLTVPNIIDGFDKEAHAIWGDVAIMLPWSIYVATGDEGLLRKQYHSMKSWLNAIPRRPNGLWDYTADWKLGDWLDPAAPPDDCGNATTDPLMVSDAFLVHATTLISKVSVVAGDADETAHFIKLAQQLRKAFAHEYVTPAGLLAADTQTAYSLAICFDLFQDAEQIERAASRLAYIIRSKSRFKIATGFAGTPFVGHALTKTGRSDVFYRMLMHRKSPSWLYPVTMGATTIWERWDSMLPDGSINPGEMTSFNHYALGAVADWMHESIGGLKAIEPGWRVIGIEPKPGGGLDWAETKHITPYGECTVSWYVQPKKKGTGRLLQVDVTVPHNTQAHVKLPGFDTTTTIGSGSYSWSVPYEFDNWPPRAIYPPTMPADDALPEDEKLPRQV